MKGLNDFSLEAQKQYQRLKKEGYYLKPCVFDNTVIYSICKDTGESIRSLWGETNEKTANLLNRVFGFEFKNEKSYFGKETPITGYNIRQEVFN